MRKLFDIYPKYEARPFEFSCIRKFTSGSTSNWHMLCSYIFVRDGWNHLVDSCPFLTNGPFKIDRLRHQQHR
jgi:hypothetical protein